MRLQAAGIVGIDARGSARKAVREICGWLSAADRLPGCKGAPATTCPSTAYIGGSGLRGFRKRGAPATRQNRRWSVEFVSDGVATGKVIGVDHRRTTARESPTRLTLLAIARRFMDKALWIGSTASACRIRLESRK
jgi:hypothetical protein